MVEDHRVRRATSADSETLSDVLARAFFDDPVLEWMYRGDRARMRGGRSFFRRRLDDLLRDEDVFTTEGLAGAAVWAPPDRWHVELAQQLRLTHALALTGTRLPRVYAGFNLIERKHRSEPHYYLAVLGTDPLLQGRGVGSAVLRPILERCDRDGVPAYLETAKERNIAFYARHGFRVTEQIQLPKGPPMWLMWRDPGAR
ncbi:MAG TPA: GNAT family N-acetyltransferase [Solirubrobacteraceae bacterium]|nr:GNAT family N-acetyltransferase [Solirubrobacteraceae bacterium]